MQTIDRPDEKRFSDVGHNRFLAAFVGLILGDIATNKSVTIAKGILCLKKSGCSYNMVQVANLALTAITALICLALIFGAFAAKRKWVSYEQVALSLIAALVIAFFTILDLSLPGYSDSGLLSLENKLYYLVWAVVIWVVPVIPLHLLQTPTRQYTQTMRRGISLCALSASMAVVCGLTGYLLMELMTIAKLEHNQWIVRPSTVNTILGAYVVVASASVWWRDLWTLDRLARILWVIGFVAFAFLYAGYFGVAFHGNENDAPQWRPFVVLGAFPVVSVAVVVLIYRMTRRSGDGCMVSWSVSSSYWSLMPTSLAVGFGIIAWLGLSHLVSPGQYLLFIVAHALNGFVLGLSLKLVQPALRWLVS